LTHYGVASAVTLSQLSSVKQTNPTEHVRAVIYLIAVGCEPHDHPARINGIHHAWAAFRRTIDLQGGDVKAADEEIPKPVGVAQQQSVTGMNR